MSFSGKYQMESHDNFESFMEAVGLPDELIQEGKDIKSISEIEETGDHFKVTVTTGTKILTNSFTLGQETELETLTGEKVNSVVMREGNKLKVSLKGIDSVTELADANTLVNVSPGLMDWGVEGKLNDTISGLIYKDCLCCPLCSNYS
uniref:Fatty acid binding protein 1 n=1 Tax=Oncorhynchus kisutch TaxID=8019 RepID=A0A8C7H0S3_ONCKI